MTQRNPNASIENLSTQQVIDMEDAYAAHTYQSILVHTFFYIHPQAFIFFSFLAFFMPSSPKS